MGCWALSFPVVSLKTVLIEPNLTYTSPEPATMVLSDFKHEVVWCHRSFSPPLFPEPAVRPLGLGILMIVEHVFMSSIVEADKLPELDVMLRTIVRRLYGVVWEPYFTIDLDGNIELGLVGGELAYFPSACALRSFLSIIDDVVYLQTSMPVLVSAGLEVVIGHWYVGYCALDLSCFPFGHSFSFLFLLLSGLSLDGV